MIEYSLSVLGTVDEQIVAYSVLWGRYAHRSSTIVIDNFNVYNFSVGWLGNSGILVSKWDGQSLVANIADASNVPELVEDRVPRCIHAWKDGNNILVAIGASASLVKDVDHRLVVLRFDKQTNQFEFLDSAPHVTVIDSLTVGRKTGGDTFLVLGTMKDRGEELEQRPNVVVYEWNRQSETLSFIAESEFNIAMSCHAVGAWESGGDLYISSAYRTYSGTVGTKSFELFKLTNNELTFLAGHRLEAEGSFYTFGTGGVDDGQGGSYIYIGIEKQPYARLLHWDGVNATLVGTYTIYNRSAHSVHLDKSTDRWFILAGGTTINAKGRVVLLEGVDMSLVYQSNADFLDLDGNYIAESSAMDSDGNGNIFSFVSARDGLDSNKHRSYLIKASIPIDTPIISSQQVNSQIQISWNYP